MSALDFSHFKKIAQDKKCATLKHPDGHEIKIAIVNLNPALKKKLEALPLHQAEGSEEPVQPLDNESPAEADHEIAGVEKEVEHAPPQAPAQPQAAPAAPMPAQPTQEAPAAPQPQQAPETTVPIDNAAVVPEPTPEQTAAQKTQQDIHFASDLQNGHIKPKTYGDLFAEKSTLGKIGTIFGLMLAGAGSGLTHQPNALLSMMDKQIQNDLEAQKTDQTNRQNWWKLSVEKERNDTQNALTNSETGQKLTANDREQFMNSKMGVVKSIATLNAENKMYLTAIQTKQDAVNKMPPGPQRDQAQNEINNTIIPTAFKKMQENNIKAAGFQHSIMDDAKKIKPSSGIKTAQNKKEVNIDEGPIDQKKYQQMVTQGKLLSGSGYVDPNQGVDPADNASLEKAITESNVNWKNYKDVADVANQLTKMERAGQAPLEGVKAIAKKIPWIGEALASGVDLAQGSQERPRDVLVNALSQRLAAHGASDKTISEIKDSLTPNMFDSPKTIKMLEETLYQHFAHNDKEQAGIFSKYPKLKKDLPKMSISAGATEKSAGPEKSFFEKAKDYTIPSRTEKKQ